MDVDGHVELDDALPEGEVALGVEIVAFIRGASVGSWAWLSRGI
jgi:hypothetical protein